MAKEKKNEKGGIKRGLMKKGGSVVCNNQKVSETMVGGVWGREKGGNEEKEQRERDGRVWESRGEKKERKEGKKKKSEE